LVNDVINIIIYGRAYLVKIVTLPSKDEEEMVICTLPSFDDVRGISMSKSLE
jgi:hypothetical protein